MAYNHPVSGVHPNFLGDGHTNQPLRVARCRSGTALVSCGGHWRRRIHHRAREAVIGQSRAEWIVRVVSPSLYGALVQARYRWPVAGPINHRGDGIDR